MSFKLVTAILLLMGLGFLGTAIKGLVTGRTRWSSGTDRLSYIVSRQDEPWKYWSTILFFLFFGIASGIGGVVTLFD